MWYNSIAMYGPSLALIIATEYKQDVIRWSTTNVGRCGQEDMSPCCICALYKGEVQTDGIMDSYVPAMYSIFYICTYIDTCISLAIRVHVPVPPKCNYPPTL